MLFLALSFILGIVIIVKIAYRIRTGFVMPKIFVFTKKTAYMQRIADVVRTGHHWHVSGEVPLDKVGVLYNKFSRLYAVDISKLEASRKRKAGYASARLFMLHQEDAGVLRWILLKTDGRAVVDGTEKLEHWQDGLKPDQRVTVTGYELVRIAKAKAQHPVWTWRYTKDREAALRETLVQVIRRKDDKALHEMIHTLWRTPGFAGAREQVKRMGALIGKEWERSRGKAEKRPEIPARLGYVRRLKDIGKYWSDRNGGVLRGHREKRSHTLLLPAEAGGEAGRDPGGGPATEPQGEL